MIKENLSKSVVGNCNDRQNVTLTDAETDRQTDIKVIRVIRVSRVKALSGLLGLGLILANESADCATKKTSIFNTLRRRASMR